MQALSEVLPTVAQQKVEKGGFMVLRPDSGDPVKTVLMALEAAEKVFGVDTNSKGYKTPRGCGVIQGDAVTMQSLQEILGAVLEKGYSAQVLVRLVVSLSSWSQASIFVTCSRLVVKERKQPCCDRKCMR